jgi:hypothetical protein
MAGPVVEGETVRGQITHPGYEHLTMRVLIERDPPEEYFAWRWHPHAIDPTKDYSAEPTTLVEFRLRDVDGGTELSVVESGFSRIRLERRDQALCMNEGGWASQMANIERHVSRL